MRDFSFQDVSEVQDLILFPKSLDGIAPGMFQSVSETTSLEQGGLTAWPEAVQWLLRSFVTNEAI